MVNTLITLFITALIAAVGVVLSVEIHEANKEKNIVDYDYYKEYKL